MERSWSCFGSTSEGVLVSAHCAVVVFGKAITSLMELAPASIITILSNPLAIPPANNIPDAHQPCLNNLVHHHHHHHHKSGIKLLTYHEEEHPCQEPPEDSQTLLQPVCRKQHEKRLFCNNQSNKVILTSSAEMPMISRTFSWTSRLYILKLPPPI